MHVCTQAHKGQGSNLSLLLNTYTYAYTHTHTHTHSVFVSLALSVSLCTCLSMKFKSVPHTHTNTHTHTHKHKHILAKRNNTEGKVTGTTQPGQGHTKKAWFFFIFCIPGHARSSVWCVRLSPQSAAVSQPVPKLPVGIHQTGPCLASQSIEGGAGLQDVVGGLRTCAARAFA